MYSSDGCKFTVPLSDSNVPSLKQIPTSFRDEEETICCVLVFDVALSFQLVVRKKILD